MATNLRAAIYARFSSDLQRDASIDDQVRTCKAFAKGRGLNVVEVYSDRAVSGASMHRNGLQALLRDAEDRAFDIVITEGLDRLSRNQADIAAIYEQLDYWDVSIETTSDGRITEINIGLQGTMNAMYLKDLSRKTHRGLKGRALQGKSAGGKAYGYTVVHETGPGGEVVRGSRVINPDEARVVRRIFEDYARGISPKKIAEQLNSERVPGPTGRHWGTSTIHGNRERGTGIINNELYIGRQVWNRLRYVKEPRTGKRVSRLNPPSEWTVTDVPELRIIDQDLWDRVRARQGKQKVKHTDVPIWDRRRPRYLLSGLAQCGCCGGGFSMISRDALGCSTARNKGDAVCGNRATIKRQDLEHRVLHAMEHNLMDPEAVRIFCEEYTAERNRLQAEAHAGRQGLEGELSRVQRDHAKLVDAIVAGVPPEQLKDRMNALEARRLELEAALSACEDPDPVRLHPAMARTYRARIGDLIRGLSEAEAMDEAREALRGLVDRIVLTPASEGSGLEIELHGALAGLLRLATGQPVHAAAETRKARDGGSQAFDIAEQVVLVAGAGFEPAAFRL
ncbi:recombinase family protein [Halovulum sp. GXIMD14794]